MDKPTNNPTAKSEAPIWIIVSCAGFMMVIQTLSSALAVIGYDDVIRADAKSREKALLNTVETTAKFEDNLLRLQLQLNAQIVDSTARLELLEKYSHKSGAQRKQK